MALIVTKLSNNVIRSYNTVTRYGENIESPNWSAVLTPASLTINAFGKVVGVIYTDQALNKGNSIFSYTVPSDVPASAYTDQSGDGGAVATSASKVKVLNNIFTDLALEPVSTGVVACTQYWPGSSNTGVGGLFISSSTGTVDNVRVFKALDGFWLRYSGTINPDHAGAIGKVDPSFRFRSPPVNFVPKVLLSDFFASLSAAQSWYSNAGVLSLTESVNNASFQQCLTLGETEVSTKAYYFNRPILYFSNLSLVGEGSTSTYFVFDANNAFLPRLESTTQIGLSEIYKQNMTFRGFCCYGVISAVGDPVQPSTPTPFLETSSGFYLPKKAPDPAPDATSSNPQMLNVVFQDLSFERFAGHGISLGNCFNIQLDRVRGESNRGFGIRTFTSNSVIYRECYVGKFNGLGGYWLENGGTLTNCNGIDNFDKRPGVVFGAPGSSQRVTAKTLGGNIEGSERLIDLHGDGSSLNIVDTTLQWYQTDVNYPAIQVHGYNCNITFDTPYVGYQGASPVKTKPVNFMWVRGSGNGHNVKVLNMPKFSLADGYLTYRVVNATGGDLYGGNGSPLELRPTENRVGVIGEYGNPVNLNPIPTQFPTVFVKDQIIGTVDISTPLPTIAARAGIYINVNAAATVANKLFIKIGTDANGWKAL